MTVNDQSQGLAESTTLAGLDGLLARLYIVDWERLLYAAILLIAIVSRFWDLGARVMSHDESLHTRFSWYLYKGDGFQHTPLMHGPVLFHMVAFSYLLFGDNDFTARIYAAVVGIIVVMFPFLFRRWLGIVGALCASFMLLISPLVLYYSRYIREDMPAVLGALIMVYAVWNYIEQREFKYLLWLAFGQFYLFASKEVSFIYIAIFGSFLTLYFIGRLFGVKWRSRAAFDIYWISLAATTVLLFFLMVFALQSGIFHSLLDGNPAAIGLDTPAPTAPCPTAHPIDIPLVTIGSLLGISILTATGAVIVGQRSNLRKFPELDAMVVMGTLIFTQLSPFVINMLGGNAASQTQDCIDFSARITIPMFFISILVGVAWGFVPPEYPSSGAEEADSEDSTGQGLWKWIKAIIWNRFWAIAGIFWGLFFLFFTTMFTNIVPGLATGIVGSLAYWLEQQGVQRGGQPWYYYLVVMLPIYEFLPLILSLVAGIVALFDLLRDLVRWVLASRPSAAIDVVTNQADDIGTVQEKSAPARKWLDLDAAIPFPWLTFTFYWVIMNVIFYSYAGEKMPWLTTHLTLPLILIGGWLAGNALQRIEWPRFWESHAWLLFVLIPVCFVVLLRLVGPTCAIFPTFLPCNTIIPDSYRQGLGGFAIIEQQNTFAWLAALVVFVGLSVAIYTYARRIPITQTIRVIGILCMIWLVFATVRAAWRAAYVDYNQATEYLVYAHSAGAVKEEVMSKIEEISLRTTDGYGLRVAYDDKVSWPFSWYLRNYYNATYFADQPSRAIGDAPVIIAGPNNWAKVEAITGDRYHKFEYIRMWWPMQEYYDLKEHFYTDWAAFLNNPQLQRGIWEIFYDRNYQTFGSAVDRSFELSRWPLADRMRLYIRKDVFAQVWSYGVDQSQAIKAIDPYAQNVKQIAPDLSFGSGYLNRPHGMALGPDGLLYVADTGDYRIVVFNPDGEVVRTFSKQGDAPADDVLKEPWDVGVGPDNTVSIADTWNHRIVEYTFDGEFLAARGHYGAGEVSDPYAFYGPRGIAVDENGTVFLSDTGNKRVQVFDSAGKFLITIGADGSLEGQVDEPVGIAVSKTSGLIYVADTWNQRIVVFNKDGRFERMWQVEAWYAQFSESNERPYITLDAQDNVYVTDPDAYRIIVFDNVGRFLYTFGDFDTISLAGGVEMDDHGHLYVSDTQDGLIRRFDISALIGGSTGDQ